MARVVFVLVDACRADFIGCHARRDLGTPTLDRLADQGVVFANAVAQFPSTRASVSSLFTGLYPTQHCLVDRVLETKEGPVSVVGLHEGVPTLAEMLAGAGHVTAAFVAGNPNLKPVFGLTRGFLHIDYLPTVEGSVLVDRFARFVEAGLPGNFFCYLHFMDVHNPLPNQVIPSRLDRGLDLDLVKERMDQLVEHYAAAVRLVDDHIGRVLDMLEVAGALDDTLIIVTADHGEEHHEHGVMLAHGHSLHRELVHVPLIMRLPDGAFAGTVVDQPVQLIDLMPTILEVAGCSRAGLAGRSLLPAVQGKDGDPVPAFSELLRPDRYWQSATTSTHQLIVSYLFEEAATASLADLQPGVTVHCAGQPIQTGSFLTTVCSLILDRPPSVGGAVAAVNPETGSLTVLGVSFDTDEATSWLGLEEEPIEPSAIRVGDFISAVLVKAASGGYRATQVHRRPRGGLSWLVGPLERIRDLENGMRLVTVLGTDIVVGDVILEARYERFQQIEVDPPTRVLEADYLKREVELYDLAADPCQARNIVDERPDIAQELEAQLAAWTEQLVTRTPVSAPSVDVDPETLEQLRRMGYLE